MRTAALDGIDDALPGGPDQEYAFRLPPGSDMTPFFVLVILPIAIGALAEAAFRDAKRASLAGGIGAAVAVCIAVQALDRDASWSWLAGALVCPLPAALAIGTVLFWYGRTTARRRHRARGA